MGDATGYAGLAATALSTAATVYGASKSAKAASAIKAPVVAKPAVMPTPDDQAVEDAKRRALLSQQTRSSRASTDLFDKTDLLGG